MTPLAPTDPSKTTLTGRVVTMDDDFTVHARGAIYVESGKIIAAQDAGAPTPPGFEDIAPVRLGGTAFPGLIELHNHLAYDALQLWQVPQEVHQP